MYEEKINLALEIANTLPEEARGNSTVALEAAKTWIAEHKELADDEMGTALAELRLTAALENIVTVAFVRGLLTPEYEAKYREITAKDLESGYKDLVSQKTVEVNEIAESAQSLVREWNEKQQAQNDMFGKPEAKADNA